MARKRDNEANSADASKRRKVAATDDSTDDVYNVDQLDWKEVQLPDRLNDTEGFFGLEEIDGVDILKGLKQGEVKFKASKKKVKKDEVESDNKFKDDEWDGFGSDAEPAIEEPTAEAPVDEKPAQKGVKENKKKKEKNARFQERKKAEKKEKNKTKAQEKIQEPAKIQQASFAALEEEAAEDVDISAWDSLDLHSEIQIALSKLKFTTPTPIQSACIPQVSAGHDVVGKASTGSGKTLAFGIPILEHYLDVQHSKSDNQAEKEETDPIALILSPTRELAHQITNHITELIDSAPNTDARIASLTGGLSMQKQQRLLSKTDIIVATPGRLWEMISSVPGFLERLKKIRFLVVDEADRLLSEGHFKELAEILNALDRIVVDEAPDEDEEESGAETEEQKAKHERQTLVFSATFHKGLQQKLAGKNQFGGDLLSQQESMEYLLKKLHFREEKPKFIDVNPVSQMAENLKEGLIECSPMDKDLYLYSTLLCYPKHRTLVFTNAISAVRRLTNFLQSLNLPTLALHSGMLQKARLRSMERFSSPTSDPSSILVATDVAARGLDIKGVDLIIHYHVPRTADSYVHRSGRTARASASGKSILICAPDEVVGVARLAAKVHNTSASGAKSVPLQSVDLDRRIISRIKPRVTLAKKIVESTIAKERLNTEDSWLRTAADELGVDYDSDQFAQELSKQRGRNRGGGREAKQRKAGSMTKAELASLRAQLKELLSKKVNIGISERYLTAGRVDIDALLRGEGNNAFLGQIDALDF